MPNFIATNKFKCPYCNEMLNAASGFESKDKPQHDSFTVCEFCISLCVYVMHEGNISLRKIDEADMDYIKKHNMESDIKMFKEFVMKKPK